jgi:acetoacetate decarboxylase
LAPQAYKRPRPSVAAGSVLALGNVAKFAVLNVLSGTHFVADVTLGTGEVVHGYLA